MRRNLVAFGLFIAWCILVGIGSTSARFAKSADFILLLLHLALLIVLSISRIWEQVGGPRRGNTPISPQGDGRSGNVPPNFVPGV